MRKKISEIGRKKLTNVKIFREKSLWKKIRNILKYLKELKIKVNISKKYTVDAFEMIVEGLGK